MSAPELPDAGKGAEVGRGGRRSPLKTKPLASLREAFGLFPIRAALTGMLTPIVLGLVMGGVDGGSVEEVLPLSRKVRGPEHPGTLGAMTNLAIAYFATG